MITEGRNAYANGAAQACPAPGKPTWATAIASALLARLASMGSGTRPDVTDEDIGREPNRVNAKTETPSPLIDNGDVEGRNRRAVARQHSGSADRSGERAAVGGLGYRLSARRNPIEAEQDDPLKIQSRGTHESDNT